jgi:hypothetical protein
MKIAGINIKDCFLHEQFFVTCSRVNTPTSLVILTLTRNTSNIVYKEVLYYNCCHKLLLFIIYPLKIIDIIG